MYLRSRNLALLMSSLAWPQDSANMDHIHTGLLSVQWTHESDGRPLSPETVILPLFFQFKTVTIQGTNHVLVDILRLLLMKNKENGVDLVLVWILAVF